MHSNRTISYNLLYGVDFMDFGDILKISREEKSLTREDLAKGVKYLVFCRV
jgi:hypothetical protein